VGAVHAPIVLCAARLEERKGIADLIRAASLLQDHVPGVQVVIAGKGPDEDRLRGLIAAEGSSAFVHLIGFRDDVGDLFASADVLCLPSYIEGLPVSLLEAMHAGLVCVATGVGGTPFVVRDGETGLLVRPADPAGLAAALARVLTDETLRDGLASAARSMVRREFTPQTMASGYAALYREVMSAGRRA
jgi:glycosyltransferase involved in cell wall biosynthesis